MELSLLIPADRVVEIDNKLKAWSAEDRTNNPCFNPNQTAYWHSNDPLRGGNQRLVVQGARPALAADGLRDMLREFPLCESSFAYETRESRLLPWETTVEYMARATHEDLAWIMEVLRNHCPMWDENQRTLYCDRQFANAALNALERVDEAKWYKIKIAAVVLRYAELNMCEVLDA